MAQSALAEQGDAPVAVAEELATAAAPADTTMPIPNAIAKASAPAATAAWPQDGVQQNVTVLWRGIAMKSIGMAKMAQTAGLGLRAGEGLARVRELLQRERTVAETMHCARRSLAPPIESPRYWGGGAL